MTLPLIAVSEKPESLCDRLARYFSERPNQWIKAQDLFAVAGAMAWRTRVSDLRKPPHNMAIENRVRAVKAAGAVKYTVSEYRFTQ